MDLASLLQFSARVVTLLVSVVLLASGMGVPALLIGTFAGYFWMHMATTVSVRRLMGENCFSLRAVDPQRLRGILGFGGGIFACNLCGMMLGPYNKFMLTRYAGLAAVPVYELAWSVAGQARGLVDSGLKALMPEIARLAGAAKSDSHGRIAALETRSVKLIAAGGLLVFGTAIALAGPGARLWLGHRYNPLLPGAARVMLLGAFVSSLAVPAYYALFGLGRIWNLITAQAIQAAVNVAVIWAFAARYSHLSPIVVCAASSAGMVVTAVYLMVMRRSVFYSSRQTPQQGASEAGASLAGVAG
jgi:O-antigen/teichoic acid export membrane protein